jgi:hypothetical protein
LITNLLLVTKTIKNNSPGTCYNANTANKFLTTLGNIVTSTKNGGALIDEVSDHWVDAVYEITTCQFNTKICGETASKYAGTDLQQQFGIQDQSISKQFCDNFQVVSFGDSSGINGCLQYECVDSPSSGLLDVSALVAQDDVNMEVSTVAKVSFLNSLSQTIPIKNGNINGNIFLTPAQTATYGLSLYDPISPGDFLIVPAMLDVTNATNTAYSTSGVSFVSYESSTGQVQFQANTTGIFVKYSNA